MQQEKYWYVYIIECGNGCYYTGLTYDLLFRWWQHKNGKGSRYTIKYGVKKIVYYEVYDNLNEARYRERQIKDWSQKKKERLINGVWGQGY